MHAQHLSFERELRVGEGGHVSVELADGLRWLLVTERSASTIELRYFSQQRIALANGWYSVLPAAAGDFDGDGRADVVLTNASDVRIKFGAALQSLVIR